MAQSFTQQILASRAVIRLAGEAPLAFLHNLLTCEVAQLPAGQWTYGALLSPQGKIQHDVFVIHDGEQVFVDCSTSQRDALLQKLKLYRLRAKIEIAAEDTRAVAVGTNEGLASADPRDATLGLRAVVSAKSLPVGQGYDASRLALGLADSDSDIGVNQLFPHEANFDQWGGVSFSKGCYVGQEVVSRMQHRGTARSRILPVTSDSEPPAEGSGIRSGEMVIGEMLSSAGNAGLALIRLDRLADARAPLLSETVSIHVHKPAWMKAEFSIPEIAA
jgi:folate-binding protein YgfZ